MALRFHKPWKIVEYEHEYRAHACQITTALARLVDRERVKQASLEIVRFEFQLRAVDGHEHDMMAAANMVLTEPARRWTRAAAEGPQRLSRKNAPKGHNTIAQGRAKIGEVDRSAALG